MKRSPLSSPWVLILAGGDGMRLRPLTQHISGDQRPKQFCPILDGETLLDRTRRRAALLVPEERQVVVVSRPHERYFGDLRASVPDSRLVVQPANRGTGPGILVPLLRIAATAGDVPVIVLPSDHHISDDETLAAHLAAAVAAVNYRPDVVVLLGIVPRSPEGDYGWIDPDRPPYRRSSPMVLPIRRFWEKPGRPRAARLAARGCLWNSFMMVGFVHSFLLLIRETAPWLLADLEPIWRARSAAEEASALDAVYADLAPVNFSERVLVRGSHRLVTLPVSDLEWCDWGDPARVLATLRRTGARPAWLTGAELEVAV